jgi:M6 family metalloprotease-like protein
MLDTMQGLPLSLSLPTELKIFKVYRDKRNSCILWYTHLETSLINHLGLHVMYLYYGGIAKNDVIANHVLRPVSVSLLIASLILTPIAFSTVPKVDADHYSDHATSPSGNVRRPLLVILTEFTDRAHVTSAKTLSNMVFGDSSSVRDFLLEVSRNEFTFTNAGVIGWFIPTDDPTTEADESSLSGYWQPAGIMEKRRYLLSQIDNQIDFSAFDDNGNGVVTSGELGILWIYANACSGTPGITRNVTWESADGVSLNLAFASMKEGCAKVCNLAHETGHLLDGGGPGDLYTYSGDGNYAFPNTYDLFALSCGIQPSVPHPNAWTRMHLGWTPTTDLLTEGWKTIEDVETDGVPLIIRSPLATSTSEGVLIENRWPGNSYEKNLKDRGLMMWHFLDGSSGFDYVDSNGNPIGGDRNNLKHLPPSCSEDKALWDGNGSCYDGFAFNWELSTKPAPKVICISPPGATMRFYLDLPGNGYRNPVSDGLCKPDLLVRNTAITFWVDGVKVTNPSAGDHVTIKVPVENWGDRKTDCGVECNEEVVVVLRIDGVKASTETISKEILMSRSWFKPASVTVNFSWTPSDDGQHVITVTVDPNSLVPDKLRSNNSTQKTVTVAA